MTKYEDGIKTFKPHGELEIYQHDKTGLYVIPKLGISARALSINGEPVALTGSDASLHCSPKTVEHCPIEYKAGLIAIKSE